MEEIDRLHLALLVENLEAHLVALEIERAGLSFEIDSPQTTAERKTEAMERRDEALTEWGKIMTELQDLRSVG